MTNELHKKIKNVLKTDFEKCSMILTLLGASGIMAKFISEKHGHISRVPVEVRYAMALTANNMLAIINNEKEVRSYHFPEEKELQVTEQQEEAIFRKMKAVVEYLYDQLQKEETEFN